MSFPKISVYTTSYCPYCVKAKNLLIKKSLPFEEFILDGDDNARMELVKKSNGKKTVPQIFIDDFHVGGCDELYDLDSSGELEKIISSKIK